MNDPSSFNLGAFLANSCFSVVEFCVETNASSNPCLGDLKSQFTGVKFTEAPIGSSEDFTYTVGHPDVCAASSFALFKGEENVETLPGGDFDALVAAIQKHNFPTEETPKDASEDTLSPSIPLSSRALDYMWKSSALSNADPRALPPTRQLGNALSQLRITFLSKIQRNAIRVVKETQLVEPTLALYCPVEGGEYVVDATVKELAAKTDSEVQVVDMAQVAAGEWGVLGKLASGFRLKKNPLGKVKLGESLDADDGKNNNIESFKLFWETVIKSDPPQTPTAACRGDKDEAASAISRPRSRIIYIRDFGLLASRVSTWFLPLYSAICTRRTGHGLSKPPMSGFLGERKWAYFGVADVVWSLRQLSKTGQAVWSKSSLRFGSGASILTANLSIAFGPLLV